MPWFVKASGAGSGSPVLVPDYMADTVARLHKEGWAEVPDPASVPDAPAPSAYIDPDPQQSASREAEAAEAHVRDVVVRNTHARAWVSGSGSASAAGGSGGRTSRKGAR